MPSFHNLFLISGRDSNSEDDDSVFIVEANDLGSAIDLASKEFSSKESDVEIFVNLSLADAVNERLIDKNLVKDERVLPLLNMYVLSGRVIGDDDDSVHIVEANDLGSAQAVFEQQLRADYEGVGFDNASDKYEVIVTYDHSLIDAVSQRLSNERASFIENDPGCR